MKIAFKRNINPECTTGGKEMNRMSVVLHTIPGLLAKVRWLDWPPCLIAQEN
jgi:hypothetical protein